MRTVPDGQAYNNCYLQMAAVRSYTNREVNFYNPAVNASQNGCVSEKIIYIGSNRLVDRKLPKS